MSDTRFALDEVAVLAGRAMGKVDLWGHRGATLVSAEETVAMAVALALLGLIPIPPGAGAPVPLDHPLDPLKGPADV